MIKKIIIPYFLILSIIAIASPQAPDILIIKNDTIEIYKLPINNLPKTKKNLFYKNLNKQLEEYRITNLHRGYIGVWELENGKLYLKNLKNVTDSNSLIKNTFTKNKNGKILADWFSDYLIIPKGRMLRWDGIFSRTYAKEEILYFKKGILTNSTLINNYIDLKNGISRLEEKTIKKTIIESISKLNWEKLSDCDCDDDYYITIGKKGIINDVEFVSYLDTKWQNFWYSFEYRKCIGLIKKQLKELKFDIIKWNGKPYKEKYRINFYYDSKKKILKNSL